VSVVVVTFDGQLAYVVGHVFCCDLHARGVASVSHVEACCVQSTHAAPSEPQRESTKPAKHVPCWQQPGHVCAVHVVAHVPLEHVSWFCVQSVHERPPNPHCVSLSLVMHVPFEQHPFGHVCGPHVGGVPSH
jgi:hypothetical protein